MANDSQMLAHRLRAAILLFVSLLGCFALSATSMDTPTTDAATKHAHPLAKQIAFEPNRGQSADAVRFIARGGDFTAFFTATDVVFKPRTGRGRSPEGTDPPSTVRMALVGANPSPAVTPETLLAGKVNYVAGMASDASLENIPTYAKIRYASVYPGIDLVWYDSAGRLEYDFIVGAGADPGVISLAFDGAHSIEIDGSGALVIRTTSGELRQPAPFVYQQRDGELQRIAADWVLTGAHTAAIHVGSYDRSHALVIDPLFVYSTYLGGNGDDWGMDIAVDAAGNTYVAGGTTSPNFPGTAPRGTTADAGFVTKLSSSGQLLYSTYILQTDERGAVGVAVDTMGNAYATGRTSLYRSTASNDAFVVKLDALGRVTPSGYFFTFGGSGIDWANRIAVDGSGYAYVTGTTSGGTFPTTPGAFRRVPAGGRDAFVSKVNPTGTGLVYSTLIGGRGDDGANDIGRDIAGNVYITGSTTSDNFPVTAAGFQRTHRGCYTSATGFVNCGKTAFVAKLNPWGTALAYSTYLGGSGLDQETIAEGIAVDANGNAHVTGSTSASDFPTTAGVIQPSSGWPLCYYEQCTDAFVTKLNASGSALVYSTYLFGEAQDAGNGIAVDGSGNVYVTGSTVSRYFPVVNAFQPEGGSFRDAFVTKLNPTASRILYSSYLGGWGSPDAFAGASGGIAIAVDAYGRAHVTGATFANDFRVTAGAAQRTWGGCNSTIYPCSDAFVSKIAASGGGVTQATTVSMTSTRAVAGSSINAAWSGMPGPTPYDRIVIYELGHDSEPYEVWGGWYTTGASAGTVQLGLPAELAPGWYEMRLWPGYSYEGPIARSAPFQVFAW